PCLSLRVVRSVAGAEADLSASCPTGRLEATTAGRGKGRCAGWRRRVCPRRGAARGWVGGAACPARGSTLPPGPPPPGGARAHTGGGRQQKGCLALRQGTACHSRKY